MSEQELSERTVVREQALIDQHTINGDVVLGEYSAVHNSVINGNIRMENATNCIITDCYIYPGENHGISITGGYNNQRSVQITHDNWPTNSITDVNQGLVELENRGYIGTDPILTAPHSIIALLDIVLPGTDITYGQFLLQNNLLSEIRGMDDEQSEVVLTVPHNARNYARTIQKPKFTDEVIETAWKLLEEYMAPTQYFAFMEGSKIELENKTGAFRLIIDKKGDFNILEGKRGMGIMATSGRVRSYDYPLGDEIATFMDWFRFKTEELISQWNCGTYGIVKEGQRR